MPELMVPPVEPSEYLEELRNHAETVSRERMEQSELHPPGLSGHEPVECSEEQESFPEGPGNLGTPLGPAFHIPMTQDRTLEELPSQIDIEWQDSVSPLPASALGTTAAAAPAYPQDSEFVEVSQIAQEAVVQASQQAASHEQPEQQEASHEQAEEPEDPPTTRLND